MSSTQWPFPYNVQWSEATAQYVQLGDVFAVNPEVELWFVCSYDAEQKRTAALKVCTAYKRALDWARYRSTAGDLELWRSDRPWEAQNREIVYANAQAARDARKT